MSRLETMESMSTRRKLATGVQRALPTHTNYPHRIETRRQQTIQCSSTERNDRVLVSRTECPPITSTIHSALKRFRFFLYIISLHRAEGEQEAIRMPNLYAQKRLPTCTVQRAKLFGCNRSRGLLGFLQITTESQSFYRFTTS